MDSRVSRVTIRKPRDTDLEAFLRLQQQYKPESRAGKSEDLKVVKAALAKAIETHGDYWICADLGGEVVGAIGVFPVESAQIHQVRRGEISDDEIQPAPNGDCHFVSGVNLLPEYRHTRLLARLLASAAYEIAQATPRIIFTQAASSAGQALILRLGFTLMPDQAEVLVDKLYSRMALDPTEVDRLVGSFLRREVALAI